MLPTYIGGAVLKSKLLDEAISFAMAAGSLGSLKLIEDLNWTLEEDDLGSKYRLQVEGIAYPIEDISNIPRIYEILFVSGSYTIPVISLLPDNDFKLSGKSVFCDLIALQKITKAAKTCTTIFLEMDTKSINIRGCNFSYSLGTIRKKWEKDAIILRQLERMYGTGA